MLLSTFFVVLPLIICMDDNITLLVSKSTVFALFISLLVAPVSLMMSREEVPFFCDSIE